MYVVTSEIVCTVPRTLHVACIAKGTKPPGTADACLGGELWLSEENVKKFMEDADVRVDFFSGFVQDLWVIFSAGIAVVIPSAIGAARLRH